MHFPAHSKLYTEVAKQTLKRFGHTLRHPEDRPKKTTLLHWHPDVEVIPNVKIRENHSTILVALYKFCRREPFTGGGSCQRQEIMAKTVPKRLRHLEKGLLPRLAERGTIFSQRSDYKQETS